MNNKEFIPLQKYLDQLADEKKSKDTTPTDGSIFREPFRVKGKAYYSLMPRVIAPEKGMVVRDFLEVDNTFAVAFPANQQFGFLRALDVYLNIKDTLEQTVYMKIKNTGFYRTDELEGFWVLLG